MRKLSNWIDGFVQYTEGKGSPLIWRKWAAIFTIAAAIERKQWLVTAKGRLFPNMYAVMVGNAGTGKSLATNLVYDLLRTLEEKKELHLAPSSVTKASLIDKLAESNRKIVNLTITPPIVSFNSLAVVPNELGVFLPAYDSEFMNVLTDLWDCKQYSETRRTHKISIDIPATQLNIFSATTPAYLNNFLPEGAWEHGFMARVILIYSGAAEYTDMFAEFNNDEELYKRLVEDLASINKQYGEFKVDEDVKEALNAWARTGGEPAPSHPKMTHYTTRRAAHLLKLCMVSCVAAGEGMTISLENYAEAMDWLTEAEKVMPDIFKAMKSGGDGRTIEECYHFIYEMHMKKRQPVQEHRVYHFLQERTPSHNVGRIIEVMERARLIKKQHTDTGIGYVPMIKNSDHT